MSAVEDKKGGDSHPAPSHASSPWIKVGVAAAAVVLLWWALGENVLGKFSMQLNGLLTVIQTKYQLIMGFILVILLFMWLRPKK